MGDPALGVGVVEAGRRALGVGVGAEAVGGRHVPGVGVGAGAVGGRHVPGVGVGAGAVGGRHVPGVGAVGVAAEGDHEVPEGAAAAAGHPQAPGVGVVAEVVAVEGLRVLGAGAVGAEEEGRWAVQGVVELEGAADPGETVLEGDLRCRVRVQGSVPPLQGSASQLVCSWLPSAGHCRRPRRAPMSARRT